MLIQYYLVNKLYIMFKCILNTQNDMENINLNLNRTSNCMYIRQNYQNSYLYQNIRKQFNLIMIQYYLTNMLYTMFKYILNTFHDMENINFNLNRISNYMYIHQHYQNSYLLYQYIRKQFNLTLIQYYLVNKLYTMFKCSCNT